MPRDAKQPFVDECRLYDANVTLVDGLITDAGRMAGEQAKQHGWYDVSTLKEPYRAEGKKTMGYELAEQLDWDAARLDRLSDRRRHRHGRACGRPSTRWKPSAGSVAKRPKMVTVQPTGCAPIVRAFDQGTEKAALWEHPDTEAHGLRVPKAIGDFLVLRAIRESGGTALAVTDRPDGRRHDRHRPSRRHLGRPGRRRGAVGGQTAGRRRAHAPRLTRSCCSTLAAPSSTSRSCTAAAEHHRAQSPRDTPSARAAASRS